jgi:coenzyme F420-reducing hydrogenase delta subunit
VEGALVYPVSCGGNLHTSVIEYLLRAGAGGVLVVSCPPRDCCNREGPKWLEQRLYHEREAELHDRVDRRRVRLVYAAEAERWAVRAALQAFRATIAALDAAAAETDIVLENQCEVSTISAEVRR